jgi:hypothetical protein
MKVGDWVFFKTRNWPKGVRITHVDAATGERRTLRAKGFTRSEARSLGLRAYEEMR